MRAGIALALLIVPLTAAWGQGVSSKDTLPVDRQPELRVPIRKPGALVALKGQPYSGETHSESIQVRADGTRIAQTGVPRKEFRDSQGRMRREQVFPPENKDGLRIVTIDDPGAGFEYVLEPGKKIVHRFTVGPRASGGAAPAAPGNFDALGMEVIQGIRAEGVRRTIGFPAVGDRAAREVVIETWTASLLQIVMREHTSDPLRGETTVLMTNLRTEEPPALLFQVPADYRVVEEEKDFAIAFSTPSEVKPPEVISRVVAKYTDEARRAGIQGTVVLAVAIDRNGRARDIQVERGIDAGLDDEAVKAVRQWRFRPGEQDGRPVRVNVHVEVTFSLLN